MYYIQSPSLHTVFLKCMGDHLYLIFLSDELCCGKPRVQILANPNHFVMSPYFTHPPTVHAWKKLVHEHKFACAPTFAQAVSCTCLELHVKFKI